MRAPDHLILLRVVAVAGPDAGADALKLIPRAVLQDIALVALFGELFLELADLGFQRRGRRDVRCESGGIQGAEREGGADLPLTGRGTIAEGYCPIWLNWNAGYNTVTLPSSQPALPKLLRHRPASMSFGTIRVIPIISFIPMKTELSLLAAAKRMDKEALEKIFDLYATSLYRYALRLCGDVLMADQIVGDVFAKLLDHLAAGNGPRSNLRSYLYQTAYHIVVDEARSSLRRAPLEALTSLTPEGTSGLLGVENHVMLEKVLAAIQHDLTEDQRHVVILRFLEEFNLRETAAILGKEVNHVRVVQHRAIAKLRTVFESSETQTAVSPPRIEEVSKPLNPDSPAAP